MKIIYTKSYDSTFKKLKKYPSGLDKLQDIISFVENSSSLEELINNPMAKLYDFERLKYGLNEFYSFRLNDKRIRLIMLPDSSGVNVIFVYISYEHYSDFDKKKVIYYDE